MELKRGGGLFRWVFVFHVQVQRRSFFRCVFGWNSKYPFQRKFGCSAISITLRFFQIFCCSLLLTTIHQHVGNMLQVVTFPNFPTCKKSLSLGIPLVGRPALFLLKLPPLVRLYLQYIAMSYFSLVAIAQMTMMMMMMMTMMMMMMIMMMMMMINFTFWDMALPCFTFYSMYLQTLPKNSTVSSLTLRICGTHISTMLCWGREIPDSLRIIIEGQGRDQFDPSLLVVGWFFRFEKGRKISGYVMYIYIYQSPKIFGWTQKYTSSRKMVYLGKYQRYFRLDIPQWVSIPWCLRIFPPPEWRCVEKEGFQSNQCQISLVI